jgi:hypothetical protein
MHIASTNNMDDRPMKATKPTKPKKANGASVIKQQDAKNAAAWASARANAIAKPPSAPAPPKLEGTLAALKATQTRQKKQLAAAKSDSEKKTLAAAIALRDERIASVLKAIKGKLLEAPKAA